MELRQIEIFRAIADERHFGRAARRLFLAQASVSGALQRLEAELGVRLVHRTSRRVDLTPAGTAFLAATDDVIAALERAAQAARQASGARTGVLRVASNYPASRRLLLPLIERLRAAAPGIQPVLRELSSGEQVDALARRELELGLLFGPITDGDIVSRALVRMPVVASVRPGHPLAGRGTVSFRDIIAFPYLTGYANGSPGIEHALIAAAASAGIDLPKGRRDMDGSAYQLLIETSDTIGFCSLSRGEQNQAHGLTMLRIGPVEPVLALHAAWSRRVDDERVNFVLGLLDEIASGGPDGA